MLSKGHEAHLRAKLIDYTLESPTCVEYVSVKFTGSVKENILQKFGLIDMLIEKDAMI